MIADPELKVAKLYDMIAPERRAHAATTPPCATVFVIGPDKKVKLMLVYPMSTGRNFDEILRVIDSLQLTAKHSVATPANWKKGDDVIVVNTIPTEEARQRFTKGVTEVKPYLRTTPDPSVREHAGTHLEASGRRDASRCWGKAPGAWASARPAGRGGGGRCGCGLELGMP